MTLCGKTTITRDGMVDFMSTEDSANLPVVPRKVRRTGRMEYRTDGGLHFTPSCLLRKVEKALLIEKIHEAGALRIEMTSRSFIVHVKLPIAMEIGDVEDSLDDELDNALEVIMKKKDELGCSIL